MFRPSPSAVFEIKQTLSFRDRFVPLPQVLLLRTAILQLWTLIGPEVMKSLFTIMKRIDFRITI